ncbi:MAG: translation initiation factor IF-2, partial [Gemmatimonadota bacterium]|nr:translation initiation factor IF-2 [Gemmatimonadota bacterium]
SAPSAADVVKVSASAGSPKDSKADSAKRRTGRGSRRRGRPSADPKVVQATIRQTMAESGGKRRRHKKKDRAHVEEAEDGNRTLRVSEFMSTSELAALMEVAASQLIGKAMELGSMVTINQRLDRDMIEMLAIEFDHEVVFEMDADEVPYREEEVDPATLAPRGPIVTIMGHVDHGKTSLLDHIRKTNVIAGEAGGITQHIGAYHVKTANGDVTFLDTPGHEAFTAMRARGAQLTDLVVLVVAADDSVMPQTVEAIDHAKAASVPILVAVNKIDRPEANPEQVRQQLTGYGITPEEWGGENIVVDVSAKTGEGVDRLLEMILLQAEVLELKASHDCAARGTIVEARKDRGRGVVVTALVQEGTLRVGDALVAGGEFGRVRAMHDERDHRVESAGPSQPVAVQGFSQVPRAGDSFLVMPSDREARDMARRRQMVLREQARRSQTHTTLENLFERIQEGTARELRAIVKGDVDGSVEAVADSLEKLSTEDVHIQIIHRGAGAITESDVLLAAASDAIILGFHVKPDPTAAGAVKREGVDCRSYGVIYEAVEDVRAAMEGLLEPEVVRKQVGRAEVRQIFRVPKLGAIAGSMVLSGEVRRKAGVLVIREGETLHEGAVASLRRFKDDVAEVKNGFECGIGVEGFPGLQEGDILEVFEDVKVARRL